MSQVYPDDVTKQLNERSTALRKLLMVLSRHERDGHRLTSDEIQNAKEALVGAINATEGASRLLVRTPKILQLAPELFAYMDDDSRHAYHREDGRF